MTIQTVNHHYTECGLPEVWVECLCTRDDAGEKTIIIPNVNSLHTLIAQKIVLSEGALTGPEIRFLRTEMGMTQTQLGKLVHRERLTISRWERGEHRLDGAVDTLLRMLASNKLKLGKVAAEKLSDKYQSATDPKSPVRIDATEIKNYPLGTVDEQLAVAA